MKKSAKDQKAKNKKKDEFDQAKYDKFDTMPLEQSKVNQDVLK